MQMRSNARWILIFVAVAAGPVWEPGIVIAAEVTIVVPEGADEVVTDAAADLSEYVRKIMGTEAEIGHEAGEGKLILVGQNAPGVSKSDLPPVGSDVEASRIMRRGDVIVIAGRDPVATANGVYTLIQKYLGVRWYTPGTMGEHVPAKERPDALEEVATETVTPVFAPREWGGFWSPKRAPADWVQWLRRNRMHSPRNSPYATGGRTASYNSWTHAFWRRVKDREEIYPLVDGKRMVVDFSRKLKPHERRAYFAPRLAGAIPTPSRPSSRHSANTSRRIRNQGAWRSAWTTSTFTVSATPAARWTAASRSVSRAPSRTFPTAGTGWSIRPLGHWRRAIRTSSSRR